MKKYRLLKLISAVALLGGGALALSQVKKAESVGAAGTKRVYIDFNNVAFQSNARIHYWGGSSESSWPGVALDGSHKIDKSSIVFSSREVSERDFYYWDIPDDTTKADILNSNGTDVWNRWNEFSVPSYNLFQPSDWGVEGWNETAGVNFTSWNLVKVTLKKADSTTVTEYNVPSWSGSGYSAPAATSGYRWVNESTSSEFINGTNLSGDIVLQEQVIPATTYEVKFYREDKTTLYDAVTVNEGGTAVCSKADPTKASVGSVAYKFAGWVDAEGNPAVLSNVSSDFSVYASFSEDRIAGRYIIGHRSWNMSDAAYMTYDSGKGEYTATVDLSYGDEFKIVYYDGSDIEWNASTDSYDKLTPTAAAFKYFGPGSGGDGDHNFKCYARGTYSFYFTDGNYDEIYKSSVALESAPNEEHLAAKLMGAGNTPGQCETLFAGMKSMFLSLGETAQAAFIAYGSLEDTVENAQFLGAYRRYVAWAAALGEKPFEEGKVSASGFFGLADSESGNLVVIVAIVSVISVSTLAALIVIKKRRAIN